MSTPYQGMFHSWNQSATGGNPVRESTGTHVARSEERNRETVPTPRFARKPSTMNSFSKQKGHTNRITWLINKCFRSRSFNLTTSPLHHLLCIGRLDSTQVSACSGCPSEAMLWIKEVEMVDSVDDFKSSCSILGVKLISRILRCWMRGLRQH